MQSTGLQWIAMDDATTRAEYVTSMSWWIVESNIE